MRQDVENYFRECDNWHRRKQGREYIAPLGEVHQPTYPFEITSMDICGPYPLAPRKNKYLLTFIGHLTKYARSNPDSRYISRNMCSSTFHPDCSQTRFRLNSSHRPGKVIYLSVFQGNTQNFWDTANALFSLQPRENRTIERLHRTMNPRLSHYVNSLGTDWDALIPMYMMTYRGTPHGTHGFSPFYLLHGRELVLPTSQGLNAN
jgi:hypothetical protein